jgi:hypothetical protein
MLLVSVLRYALCTLIPLAILFTSYLYLYPVFHLCAFPVPGGDAPSAYGYTLRQHVLPAHANPAVAPFRLLALGDPQLEGDTSIPDSEAATFPNLAKFWRDALLRDGTQHLLLERIRHSLHDLVDFYFQDVPKAFNVYRKRLDLLGNDYYLAHIYRTLHWWTKPTHVSVLGDLLGSQWIDNDEFERRGWRFWNRVFKHGSRVNDSLTADPNSDFTGYKKIEYLNEDPEWSTRLINVAGNHDVGYAGDLNAERFTRFERVFGKANYELRFHLPIPKDNASDPTLVIPELRIVVLNDMNLDTPAISQDLQDQTYSFLNGVISTSHPVERRGLMTLVLTHIPLHKEAGICVDGPFFDFHEADVGGGVKEQNHLSLDASKGFLEGIFGKSGNPAADGKGMGRNGLIMTGHDHEGCDIYHFINQSSGHEQSPSWEAKTWHSAKTDNVVALQDVPGLREITVRSMMGGFGGNAGLLSAWFDEEMWEWKFEYATCAVGVQHIWWAVHVMDLVTLIIAVLYGGLHMGRLAKGMVAPRAAEKKLPGDDNKSLGIMTNRLVVDSKDKEI